MITSVVNLVVTPGLREACDRSENIRESLEKYPEDWGWKFMLPGV